MSERMAEDSSSAAAELQRMTAERDTWRRMATTKPSQRGMRPENGYGNRNTPISVF